MPCPKGGEVTIEAHPEFAQTEVRPGHCVGTIVSDTGAGMGCLNAVRRARSITSNVYEIPNRRKKMAADQQRQHNPSLQRVLLFLVLIRGFVTAKRGSPAAWHEAVAL
jgi:hypothetical protein